MTETNIEALEEDQPRSAPAVAKRCVVLYAVLAAGHKESRKDLAEWLQREDLWDVLSPNEAMFLESKAATKQQIINTTWRAEALYTLLWALGKIKSLTPATNICDIPLLQSVLPSLFSSTSEFLSFAALRSEDDISEAHEAVYQAHWAVRDAQINNKPVPNGYHPGVIQERHHALNWLIGYCGQDWDDVTTDT